MGRETPYVETMTYGIWHMLHRSDEPSLHRVEVRITNGPNRMNDKHHAPDALRLIGDLVKGMEAWARDEDGVHADAWGAYVTARTVIGRPLTADEYDRATK